MPDLTEPQRVLAGSKQQHLAALHARMQQSRDEIFTLAHELAGDRPEQSPAEDSFPRSHVMRALVGPPGRMLLGGAALALTLMRPKMIWSVLRLGSLLRPLLTRYLLPKILGQR